MYLANGTVCLSLLGAFPVAGWGSALPYFFPEARNTVPGTPDAQEVGQGCAGTAGTRRHRGVIAVMRDGAVAVPGLGDTGGMRSFGPSSAAWPTRLR